MCLPSCLLLFMSVTNVSAFERQTQRSERTYEMFHSVGGSGLTERDREGGGGGDRQTDRQTDRRRRKRRERERQKQKDRDRETERDRDKVSKEVT